MHTSSSSQSIFQLAESAYRAPEKTRPWVVLNVLGHPGDEAYIETSCYDSGNEVAYRLSGNLFPILNIQCFMVSNGEWVQRTIHEVLMGTLGEAAVAVFRDASGIDFCPDAPDQSVSQLSDLILCGVVEGVRPADRGPLRQSYGKQLHAATHREVMLRDANRVNAFLASPA